MVDAGSGFILPSDCRGLEVVPDAQLLVFHALKEAQLKVARGEESCMRAVRFALEARQELESEALEEVARRAAVSIMVARKNTSAEAAASSEEMGGGAADDDA